MINKKKEDILRLLNLCVLQEKHKDTFLKGLVLSYVPEDKLSNQEFINKIKEIVWDLITKESFLDEAVKSYDKLFEHDEIKYMINFYKSEVSKKAASKEGIEANRCIFDKIHQTIKEVVEKEK